VDIQLLDLADKESVRDCYRVQVTARLHDSPWDSPPMSAGMFGGYLACGWASEPQEIWLARTPGGRVAGWYQLELPDLENLDRAMLHLIVHPDLRRQGFGRALLRHALDRSAGHDRSAVCGNAYRGSPGEAFARAAGAAPGLVSIRSQPLHDRR
jgi:GNAT superfamily N-acetyltransferase